MEEYLQYMKTLRCQVNDVEDHAAKISFEEQMLITGIRGLEDDLSSVKLEIKQLGEETERITKAKGNICAMLLDAQKKVAALESDSCMLVQSLEIVEQERAGLSAKLVDKSALYDEVAEKISCQFQELQDYIHSHHNNVEGSEHISGHGNEEAKCQRFYLCDAITRFNEVREMKVQLAAANAEMKQFVEQMQHQATNLKMQKELGRMDVKNLEKDHVAFLLDKGDISSLQDQMDHV